MTQLHKPFTSIAEQITLLESRGVTFMGKRPVEILQREGYYSIINGYKDPFIASYHPHDTYRDGTTFEQIHQLFCFDRDLRSLVFGATTKAEAMLRATCSYCFSENHQNEANAYLNAQNYEDPVRAYGLIKDFNRILENNGPDTKHKERIKKYIYHCIVEHGGEVPLWVLSNDLTLGQMFWFFQIQTKTVRGSIAKLYTQTFNASHKTNTEITAKKLDSIYRRIKEYRNICAHDERLYCAHPHDDNATVFQLIKDLRLVMGKNDYLEFIAKTISLLKRLNKKVPSCMEYVLHEMGIHSMDSLQDWENLCRESTKNSAKREGA